MMVTPSGAAISSAARSVSGRLTPVTRRQRTVQTSHAPGFKGGVEDGSPCRPAARRHQDGPRFFGIGWQTVWPDIAGIVEPIKKLFQIGKVSV